MDPYTPRTRPVGRKKNLALSTKEYSKVRRSLRIFRTPLDVRHRRLQERSHLQDGAVTWSMALMMNGTDAADTIFCPKVRANVPVLHLLALIVIRSFIHCGDVLRQSATELAGSITLTHHAQGSWERKIAGGESGQCVSGYSGGSHLGGPTLCLDGKLSSCSNRPCLPHIYRVLKAHTSHTTRTIRSKTMTLFAGSSLGYLRHWVNHSCSS